MSTICPQFVIFWSPKQENEEAEEAEMPYKTRKVALIKPALKFATKGNLPK